MENHHQSTPFVPRSECVHGRWNCSLEHCPGAPGALAHYPAVVWGSKPALEVAHSPPRPVEGETARGHGGKRPTARPLTVQVLWRDSVEHV